MFPGEGQSERGALPKTASKQPAQALGGEPVAAEGAPAAPRLRFGPLGADGEKWPKAFEDRWSRRKFSSFTWIIDGQVLAFC